MQLGARWQAGDPPHRGVPERLFAAIREQEAELGEQLSAGAAWTLTWLEGRPRCSLEDLVIVTIGIDGRVSTEPGSGDVYSDNANDIDDDTDDDWLK